jgi:hypothetical protein
VRILAVSRAFTVGGHPARAAVLIWSPGGAEGLVGFPPTPPNTASLTGVVWPVKMIREVSLREFCGI